MKRSELTIGQAAKAAGVRIQTLHYYERQKILIPSSRTEVGYRIYSLGDLKKLQFIKQAKELGFTLSEIKELLSLRVKPKTACDKVLKKTLQKVDEVNVRIVALKKIRKSLMDLTKSCENREETGGCPILSSIGREK